MHIEKYLAIELLPGCLDEITSYIPCVLCLSLGMDMCICRCVQSHLLLLLVLPPFQPALVANKPDIGKVTESEIQTC